MTYKRNLYLIVLLFLLISCKGQKNLVETKIEDCINKRINDGFYKYDEKGKAIDYYSVMAKFEEALLDKKMDSVGLKQQYLNLIDRVINLDTIQQQALYLKLLKIAKTDNYNGFYFSTDVLQHCPHYMTELSNNLTISMKKQINAMDMLYALDPYDQNYMNAVVTSVATDDFKKMVYRAPIMTVIFEFLGFQSGE